MADRILLVGMMGSGKTTIGRLLAERLDAGFVDSDEQVEAATGRTVREIWESEGEAAFRAQETRALREATAADGARVVGVAGGAVLDGGNRRLIKAAGTVVWLRARVDTLARRVAGGDHRPLLGDDPAGVLGRLSAERGGLYEEVADVIVDVDGLTPDEVVDHVVDQL